MVVNLVISEKKTICLNMIVKNESHIILNTLENLCSYITFAYWVISDTGSTDDTKSIITDFFKQENIPGELVEHEWKDFGYNRTKALECAYNKSDYIFIFDADDKIFGEFKLPNTYEVDRYQVKFGPHVVYTRPLLVTNRKKWCFTGVLHESLSNIDVMNGEKTLEGEYYVESGRTGNRSKNPTKYLDDAIVLKNAFTCTLAADYGLACRYAFYCGQSYKDAGPQYMDDAIEWYKKCLDLGNWVQEKYYACLMIGNLYKIKNDIPNTMKYWYKTVEYDIERMEGVVWAMKQLMADGQNLVVNALYHKFKDYKKNPQQKLFIFENDYNDEIEYHNSVCAFYVNDKESGYECCKKIILNNVISYGYLKSTLSNTLFYKDLLEKDTATSEMFYSVDNALHNISSLHKEQLDPKMIELWTLLFEKNRKKLTLYNKFSFTPRDTVKIFLSFTTCKRFDLFKQTVNSILNHWTDIDKVDYWFCVDDNSSEEDRVKMTTSYPWINYRMKTPEEKGHRQSMNIIWDKLKELGPVYWIHMEDDFLFHTKMNYVGEAISALTQLKDEKVYQILFNRNYGETIEDYKVLGHNETSSTIVVHDYKLGTFPYSNCHYWPHYSFRPAVIDVKTVLELGNFDSENQFFEMDYAKKWYAAGYKSGFFNRITNRHIGRLTSERHLNTVKNAYDLNDVSQFQQRDISRSSSSSSIKIVNLERRPDRKEATIQKMMDADMDKTGYEFVKAVDGLQLQPTKELKQIFEGNDFGSRKGVIGCALSHLNIWKQLLTDVTNEYYIIMEDDFSLAPNFKSQIETLQPELLSKDLIFLGYHMFEKHRDENKHIYEYNTSEQKSIKIEPLNKSIYIGGTHCYSINKKGAQILVNYISEHGCKHGIDYVMKIVPKLSCFETQPQLSVALWNEAGAKIDTDIQNCNDRLDFSMITPSSSASVPAQYVFVPNLDQIGFDICYHKKTLQEYFILAEKDVNCIGFNTLGFFKNKIENLTASQYFGKDDGIYIKKEYYDKLQILQLPYTDSKHTKEKKYTFTNTWFQYSNLKNLIKFTDNKCVFYNNNEIIYQLDRTNIINVLEIGSHEGAFSTFISDNLLLNDKSILHCVDPFDITDSTTPVNNNTKTIFLNNIQQSNHSSKITHFETYSDDFFNPIDDTNTHILYDFIYIDGLHTPEQVIKDINNSCLRLLPDGIIWLDDYESSLKNCIDEWLAAHNDIYDIVYKQYQIAFTPKKNKNNVVRVKMLCNWCTSEHLCKEWANMYDVRWKNIEMTWTDKREEIDYYVIINSPPPNSYFEPSKTIVFQMEPWVNDSTKNWGVKTWGKWAEPNPADFLHVHSHKTNLNNVQWQINIPLRDNVNIITQKQNIISAICSSKNYDEGHILRNNFIKYMDDDIATHTQTPSANASGVPSLFATLTTGAFGYSSLQQESTELYFLDTLNNCKHDNNLHKYIVNPLMGYYMCDQFIGNDFIVTPDGYDILKYGFKGMGEMQILYVQVNYFEFFYNTILPKITSNIILVTGQFHLPQLHITSMSDNVLNNTYIKYWFSQNPIYDHPKYIPIPYGIYYEFLPKYLDILLNTNSSNSLNKSNNLIHLYMTKENNECRKILPDVPKEDVETYYKKLSDCEFILSPIGDRPDCYRHWEAIGLGVIPISNVPHLYKKMFTDSMIYVENTSEMLKLLDNNNNNNKLVYNKPNRDVICVDYWKNIISQYKNKTPSANVSDFKYLNVYGRENYHNFKSYVGPLLDDNKLNGLAPYKYSFAAENNSENGYATEKIWEPILCECLCFYWGCPNLEDYIDSRAFVRLPLDNFEESLLIIKKAIEEDWWTQRIDIIRQEKHRILNEHGFFPTLERIIQNFLERPVAEGAGERGNSGDDCRRSSG